MIPNNIEKPSESVDEGQEQKIISDQSPPRSDSLSAENQDIKNNQNDEGNQSIIIMNGNNNIGNENIPFSLPDQKQLDETIDLHYSQYQEENNIQFPDVKENKDIDEEFQHPPPNILEEIKEQEINQGQSNRAIQEENQISEDTPGQLLEQENCLTLNKNPSIQPQNNEILPELNNVTVQNQMETEVPELVPETESPSENNIQLEDNNKIDDSNNENKEQQDESQSKKPIEGVAQTQEFNSDENKEKEREKERNFQLPFKFSVTNHRELEQKDAEKKKDEFELPKDQDKSSNGIEEEQTASPSLPASLDVVDNDGNSMNDVLLPFGRDTLELLNKYQSPPPKLKLPPSQSAVGAGGLGEQQNQKNQINAWDADQKILKMKEQLERDRRSISENSQTNYNIDREYELNIGDSMRGKLGAINALDAPITATFDPLLDSNKDPFSSKLDSSNVVPSQDQINLFSSNMNNLIDCQKETQDKPKEPGLGGVPNNGTVVDPGITIQIEPEHKNFLIEEWQNQQFEISKNLSSFQEQTFLEINETELIQKQYFMGVPGINITNVKAYDELIDFLMPESFLDHFLKYLQNNCLHIFQQGYGNITPTLEHLRQFFSMYLLLSIQKHASNEEIFQKDDPIISSRVHQFMEYDQFLVYGVVVSHINVDLVSDNFQNVLEQLNLKLSQPYIPDQQIVLYRRANSELPKDFSQIICCDEESGYVHFVLFTNQFSSEQFQAILLQNIQRTVHREQDNANHQVFFDSNILTLQTAISLFLKKIQVVGLISITDEDIPSQIQDPNNATQLKDTRILKNHNNLILLKQTQKYAFLNSFLSMKYDEQFKDRPQALCEYTKSLQKAKNGLRFEGFSNFSYLGSSRQVYLECFQIILFNSMLLWSKFQGQPFNDELIKTCKRDLLSKFFFDQLQSKNSQNKLHKAVQTDSTRRNDRPSPSPNRITQNYPISGANSTARNKSPSINSLGKRKGTPIVEMEEKLTPKKLHLNDNSVQIQGASRNDGSQSFDGNFFDSFATGTRPYLNSPANRIPNDKQKVESYTNNNNNQYYGGGGGGSENRPLMKSNHQFIQSIDQSEYCVVCPVRNKRNTLTEFYCLGCEQELKKQVFVCRDCFTAYHSRPQDFIKKPIQESSKPNSHFQRQESTMRDEEEPNYLHQIMMEMQTIKEKLRRIEDFNDDPDSQDAYYNRKQETQQVREFEKEEIRGSSIHRRGASIHRKINGRQRSASRGRVLESPRRSFGRIPTPVRNEQKRSPSNNRRLSPFRPSMPSPFRRERSMSSKRRGPNQPQAQPRGKSKSRLRQEYQVKYDKNGDPYYDND